MTKDGIEKWIDDLTTHHATRMMKVKFFDTNPSETKDVLKYITLKMREAILLKCIMGHSKEAIEQACEVATAKVERCYNEQLN